MACEPVGDICPRPGDTDNILLRKILLSLNEVGGEGGSAGLIEVVNSLIVTPEENEYWINKAASLDPKAYDLVVGSTVTVPAGVNWSSIAMWGIRDGSGVPASYQRTPSSEERMPLPAGTVLIPDVAVAFVYINKPELVTATDTRYATGQSAKALYFSRLKRLFSLALSNMSVPVPSTTPFGSIVSVSFPADFTYGMITESSAFDVSWLGLTYGGGAGTMALQYETSDNHQIRVTATAFVPFARAIFPDATCRSSSISGTPGTMLEGIGNIFYHKLPADW